MSTLTRTADRPGERADAFLARVVPDLTRSAAQRLLEAGAVRLAGRPVRKNYRTAPGDVLEVDIPAPQPVDLVPQDIPLDIVYEDGDVIVVNKPVGMVVHPAPGHSDGTLVNALLYHCGNTLSGINGTLRPWPPSSRTTACPGSMRRWRWAGCGRIAAPWTPPSADTLWTGRGWPSTGRTAGRR